MRRAILSTVVATLLGVVALPARGEDEPATLSKTMFIHEQQTFEPGYPIGDMALGAPEVADFKVMPGRRQILIFGKNVGQTNLTVWDQRGVKRHEVLLTVTTREAAQAEAELRELLKDFKNVQLRRIAGRLTVTGSVATTQEFEDVKRVAETLGVQNLVRLARAPAAPVYTLVPVTDEERLSKMLKDFPSVRVGRMSGQLYVSGSVRTDQDLEVVRRIAAALGAQTIVSVIPGTKP